MIKFYFILLFSFLLVGCSSVEPIVVEYKISTPSLESQNGLSRGCVDKSLRVSQAFGSSSLMSSKMKYIEDNHKIYAYSQAEWVNSPNQEVSAQLVKVLRESKLFKSIQNSKSRSISDFILETNIDDFMQYYSKDLKNSYANVAITLSLIDAKSNRVVASESFAKRVDVQSLDALGGVEGLNSALDSVLHESIIFLNGACQ
jgi:cholesterol transport system auxiliary component